MLEVSPNYFSMLGTTPEIGRLFGPQDFALGFAEATVISDGLWRRSYGGDPNILGKRLRMDNDPYTIVGVVPPGFRHPGKTIAGDVQVWVTCGFSGDPYPKPARNVKVAREAIGRLKPGIGVTQAQARLTAMVSELRTDFPNDYPSEAKWSIEIQPLQNALVGNVRPQLLVLMAAVILVVLIASVNIANLLLARASGRQREMALRMALDVGLKVGAGLLLRTFWGLFKENPGFKPSRVVTASLYLPVPNDPKMDVYRDFSKRTSFIRDVIRRVATIPGIERAAMTSDLPGARPSTTAALVIEDRAADSSQGLIAEVILVSPDYFMLMQSPLIRGRC